MNDHPGIAGINRLVGKDNAALVENSIRFVLVKTAESLVRRVLAK
jgi:hypothetical protein